MEVLGFIFVAARILGAEVWVLLAGNLLEVFKMRCLRSSSLAFREKLIGLNPRWWPLSICRVGLNKAVGCIPDVHSPISFPSRPWCLLAGAGYDLLELSLPSPLGWDAWPRLSPHHPASLWLQWCVQVWSCELRQWNQMEFQDFFWECFYALCWMWTRK